MASVLEGMFTTPEDIRGARLDSLMNERRAISNMGGSWDQLLGQVAAGGGNFGGMLAEGMGGMFGLKTPEEAQAEKMQALVSNVENMNDPKQLMALARQLSKSNPRVAMAMFARARELERENTQDRYAEEEAIRKQELFPLQLDQIRTGIDANRTSNSRNIQAMGFAADTEAERLATLSREKQQRELESQVIPENGENLGAYYMRVGRRAQELGLGDVAQDYFDKADQARNSRYDYQKESRYNPTKGVTETQWIRIEKATGKMEYIDGPPTTDAPTVTAEPPAKINLTSNNSGSNPSGIPLPVLTPSSTAVLPALEEYAKKMGVPQEKMLKAWSEYQKYADAVRNSNKFGMYAGSKITFEQWLKQNPILKDQGTW